VGVRDRELGRGMVGTEEGRVSDEGRVGTREQRARGRYDTRAGRISVMKTKTKSE
jgi:hypothetical protein